MHDTSYIRMQELARRSGFRASAVRYYLKQGLLPPPERPTANSALYDERHLQGLAALKSIKRLAPELPLAQVKRVMELIGQGVEPDVALSLHRSVAGGLPAQGQAPVSLTLEELAAKAGVNADFVNTLIERNILAPIPGHDRFDAADLETLGAMALLEAMAPGSISKVGEIASLIRRASALEMALRNEASKGQTSQGAAEISRQMQDWANFWHAYLFARFRLADIEQHGLGETADRNVETPQ